MLLYGTVFMAPNWRRGYMLIDEQLHACIEFNVPYKTGIYDTTEV